MGYLYWHLFSVEETGDLLWCTFLVVVDKGTLYWELHLPNGMVDVLCDVYLPWWKMIGNCTRTCAVWRGRLTGYIVSIPGGCQWWKIVLWLARSGSDGRRSMYSGHKQPTNHDWVPSHLLRSTQLKRDTVFVRVSLYKLLHLPYSRCSFGLPRSQFCCHVDVWNLHLKFHNFANISNHWRLNIAKPPTQTLIPYSAVDISYIRVSHLCEISIP